MPTNLPTVTAADMADGYRRIFEAIRLDVTFTIDEFVVTSDETAHGLTRSNGTQTVLATGDETAESNRKVFLFQRTNPDGWKIFRYMFTNPSSTPAATSGLKQRIGWIAGADLTFALDLGRRGRNRKQWTQPDRNLRGCAIWTEARTQRPDHSPR